MTTKVKIILSLILIAVLSGLIGTVSYQHKKIKNLKVENTRVQDNFFNLNQQLDSVKDKNGEYHYTIETLTLTKKELEKTNSSLSKDIKNMRLKIKNLESISRVEIKYVVKDSIIYVDKLNDTTFVSLKKDDWIENSWNSTLTDNGKNLKITNYNLQIKDSIITPVEFIYKGWWIFKKVKGVKIHVKSKNPYSNIDRVEYIRIKKK